MIEAPTDKQRKLCSVICYYFYSKAYLVGYSPEVWTDRVEAGKFIALNVNRIPKTRKYKRGGRIGAGA